MSKETKQNADRPESRLETAAAETDRQRGAETSLEQIRRMFEEMLAAEPHAVILFEAETLRVREANEAAAKLYGYSRSELEQLCFTDLSARPDQTRETVREALEARGRVSRADKHKRSDGETFPVEMSLRVLGPEGEPRAWAVVRSVAESRYTRQELLRIRAAMSSASEAVLIANLENRVLYVNQAFEDLFACSREQAGELEVGGFFSKARMADRVLQAALSGRKWEGEADVTGADGRTFTAHVRGSPVMNGSGETMDVLLLFSDITDQKEAQERLIYEATHDALTGLLNRRYLMARLDQFVYSAQRYQHPLSVCLCDVDGFKRVNDTYGHTVGDRVLKRYAQIVSDDSRASEIVGRYGGDELCALLPYTPASAAAKWAERIRGVLERTRLEGEEGEVFSITATFGIAEFSSELSEKKALLVAVDRALYAAKDEGGNCVRIYCGKTT